MLSNAIHWVMWKQSWGKKIFFANSFTITSIASLYKLVMFHTTPWCFRQLKGLVSGEFIPNLQEGSMSMLQRVWKSGQLCISNGAICLFMCTNRSFHPDWGQHLHQILEPGHGGVPAYRVPGEPCQCGCFLWLVFSHSLALLQPGGGHWSAADGSCQNNSD